MHLLQSNTTFRHRLGVLKKLTVFQSRIQAAQAAVKKFQPSRIPTQEDMDRELAGWVDTPHEPPRPFTEISAPSGPRLLDHYPPDPEVWGPNVDSMRQGPPQPDHRSSGAGHSNSMIYRAVQQNWPPVYHGPSRGTPVSRGPDHQRSNPNKIPLSGKGSGVPTLPSRQQQNESKHAVQASGETTYQKTTSSQDPAVESSDDDSETVSHCEDPELEPIKAD